MPEFAVGLRYVHASDRVRSVRLAHLARTGFFKRVHVKSAHPSAR